MGKPAFIVVTGVPGVGKTTFVRSLVDMLHKESVQTVGFVTEEVRDGGCRIGFDVVGMDGTRGVLARCSSLRNLPKVGKYFVNVPSFEEFALPMIKSTEDKLLIIDEIGRMELLSSRFKAAVSALLNSEHRPGLLVTIPVSGRGLQLVECVRNHPDAHVVQSFSFYADDGLRSVNCKAVFAAAKPNTMNYRL